MAKVRIQTRKKGVEESEDGALPEPASTASRRHRQNEGAVDILARVLRTEGFVGWYKVRSPADIGPVQLAYVLFEGHGGPNSESRALSGRAVHVQRTV
jgi:hypothetical protein